MAVQSIYSIAELPDPATQPGNVVIIADANDAEYLDAGPVPVGGGTKRVRVKSDGVVWRLYGMVRQTIDTSGGTDPIVGLNLLLNSDDFLGGAWTVLNSAVPANAGLANQALMELASVTTHHIGQEIPLIGPATLRLSIDAHNALTRGWIKLAIFDQTLASFATKYFNIATGATGTTTIVGAPFSNLVPITSSPLGGGYTVGFDIDVNATVTSVFFVVYIATADGVDSYLGVITNGMQLTDAQLNRVT